MTDAPNEKAEPIDANDDPLVALVRKGYLNGLLELARTTGSRVIVLQDIGDMMEVNSAGASQTTLANAIYVLAYEGAAMKRTCGCIDCAAAEAMLSNVLALFSADETRARTMRDAKLH